MPAHGRYAESRTIRLSRRQEEILTDLGRRVGIKDREELIRYAIDWVGVRLNADVLWQRPRQKPKRSGEPWTDDEVSLLGTMPDREFAKRFQRGFKEVYYERVRRGITAKCKPHTFDWSASDAKGT